MRRWHALVAAIYVLCALAVFRAVLPHMTASYIGVGGDPQATMWYLTSSTGSWAQATPKAA